MITIKFKEECCGCTACLNVCPSKCITMQSDEEGFLYPKVDEKQCSQCGMCEKVCPIKNVPETFPDTNTYACQSMTEDKRAKSTSGGTFFELAKWIINNDGWVCGAGFDEEGKVVHKLVNSLDELDELLGSKYVQSNPEKCYNRIRSLLNEGHYVLFVGTPCQAASIRNYFRKNNEKLIVVDLICFGVPSPGIYQKWRSHLELKYKNKIAKINFRDKSYGYAAPNVKIEFEDGRATEQNFNVKSYMKLFMKELNVRPSCYKCKFKTISKASDITLGDCWSIGRLESSMDDNRGTTGVYIHSPKGLQMFKNIESQVRNIEVDTKTAVMLDGRKMLGCVEYNDQREDFFKDSQSMTYDQLVRKYVPDSTKEKIVSIVKRLFKNSKLLRALLRNKRTNKKYKIKVVNPK